MRVIVTTTSPNVATTVDSNPVAVGVLERSESVKVLKGARSGGIEDPCDVLNRLCGVLGDVSLGIGLAAGWARKHRHSAYQILIDSLGDDSAGLLGQQPDGYDRTIDGLWEAIAPTLSDQTRDVLDELAYIRTATVNLTVLGYGDPTVLEELEESTACSITYLHSDAIGALHQLLGAAIRGTHTPPDRSDRILVRLLERAASLLGENGADHSKWPAARAIDPWVDSLPRPDPNSCLLYTSRCV